MTWRRWELAALGVVMLVWIMGGEWVSIRENVPENHFIDALTGLSFLAAGLVVLDRRPANRIGPLMIAWVMVSYLGNWGNLPVPLLPALGVSAGQQLGSPILAHVALAYPSGRLTSRFTRMVAAVIYACGLAVSVVILLAFDPREFGCSRCAWQPAVIPSRGLLDAAQLVGQRDALVLVPLLLAALWWRWKLATAAARRTLVPLWISAGILCAVYLTGGFGSADPEADQFSHLVFELQGVLQISLPVVLVWGLVSARLARSAVSDLVLELGRPLSPTELRTALATTLGDRSLDLLYAREGRQTWVDANGHPAPLPDLRQARQTVFVVERDGQPLAALVHDRALDDGLVRAAAAAAGMAIENARLQAEVQAQLEEVRASRQRIVEAGDAERRRVERNLHDGAQQRMATLALSLTMLRDQAAGQPSLVASLEKASAELKKAITDLRELARGIHPAILTEEGLSAAVEALADRSALPIRVRAGFDDRMPGSVEAVGYFVVSEALANVTKYAQATAVQVDLSRQDGCLRVEVTDNGVGGADAARGTGLRGLEDRVSAVRGRFVVHSPPGGGTRILAEIPCHG